jgi:two-component system response regulator DevR
LGAAWAWGLQWVEAAINSAEDMRVVGSFSDGATAIKEAPIVAPDVVLLDVLMPEMDGIETCRQLRELLPDTRIVMLTSHTDKDAVFAAIMAGASGYLLKNTSSRAIIEAVRAVAEGRSTLDPQVTAGVLERLRTVDPNSDVPGLKDLSEREHEVLVLVAEGLTNLEIAERLVLSPHTIRNHVSNVLTKLGVRRRSDAAVFAERHNLSGEGASGTISGDGHVG